MHPRVLSGSSTLIVAASSGVATFSNIIPTKTGTGFTLHAIDASLTAADSSSFNVTAGAAASLTVSGYPSPTAAGDSHTFTVTAKDAFDNTATGYLGTVHFTSSDGAAVLPANYTFLSGDNGTHTFSATLKTAGTQSITATDTVTASITGTESGIVVNKRSTSTAVSSSVNPSTFGQSVTFTATVTGTGDGSGNPSSDGNVTFKADGMAICS